MRDRRDLLKAFLASALAPNISWARQVSPAPLQNQSNDSQQRQALQTFFATNPQFAPHGELPKNYIDKDTGHKVVRISNKDHSGVLYFNDPAFSHDERWMAFNHPGGVSLCDLNTLEERRLIEGGLSAFAVSRQQPIVYARPQNVAVNTTTLHDYYKIDINTGSSTRIASNERGRVVAVTCDDRYLLGIFETPFEVKPPNRDVFSYRYQQRIPMELFAIDTQTGKRITILQSDDWLNHLQASPTDAKRLMYCHEGPWELTDRIWNIDLDGSNNRLIHKRSIPNEAAGHEFFSDNGKNIIYDLQTPKKQNYWLACYNIETSQNSAYAIRPEERSIHYNASRDADLFVGDGYGLIDTTQQSIFKYDTRKYSPSKLDSTPPGFSVPGTLNAEPLCRLPGHNFNILEPNVRLSPDKAWVFFMSHMMGPTHVFAVSMQPA